MFLTLKEKYYSITVNENVQIDVLTIRPNWTPSANFPVFDLRCMTWEGEWNTEIASVAAEKGRKGVYGKILLTVCGEVFDLETTTSQDSRWWCKYNWLHWFIQQGKKDSVSSSTALLQTQWPLPPGHNETDLSCTLNQSTMNETVSLLRMLGLWQPLVTFLNWFKIYIYCISFLQMTGNCSQSNDSVCIEEILVQLHQTDRSDFRLANRPPVWPTVRARPYLYFIVCSEVGIWIRISLCDERIRHPDGQ